MKWLNLPNGLTLSRVALGAACLPLLTGQNSTLLIFAFAIMICAELTDFLDGMAARATGSVTEIGKILDPMADSMYRLIIFAGFVQNGWMPAWMMAAFLIRDIAVAYCRIIAVSRNFPVAARFSGKAKAVVQGGAQVFVVGVAAFRFDGLQPLSTPLLYLAAAVTLWSLFDYAAAMLKR